jgi:hypothetical protein
MSTLIFHGDGCWPTLDSSSSQLSLNEPGADSTMVIATIQRQSDHLVCSSLEENRSLCTDSERTSIPPSTEGTGKMGLEMIQTNMKRNSNSQEAALTQSQLHSSISESSDLEIDNSISTSYPLEMFTDSRYEQPPALPTIAEWSDIDGRPALSEQGSKENQIETERESRSTHDQEESNNPKDCTQDYESVITLDEESRDYQAQQAPEFPHDLESVIQKKFAQLEREKEKKDLERREDRLAACSALVAIEGIPATARYFPTF